MTLDMPADPVQRCWFHQSRTEYTAAALVSEMTHWLLQLGLRPDLLMRSTRVVGDEIRHAALCHELYLHVGGEVRQVPLDALYLEHLDDADAALPMRAITAAAELACEETVALVVFKLRLRNATDPMVREVVEIVLQDEATHSTFAWDLFDELIEVLGHDVVRAWARPRLAGWLRNYLAAPIEDPVHVYRPDQLEFGLIDRREHWTLMRECARDTILPRFVRRGIVAADIGAEELVAELGAR